MPTNYPFVCFVRIDSISNTIIIKIKTMTISRLLYAIVLPLFLLAGTASAQDRQVTGKVTDTSGAPVINASVMAKGSKSGTTTSTAGTFSLRVPSTATSLVVSSVNFETQEVKISSGVVNITLQSANSSLAAVTVVAVGYGTLNKREVTSAVTHLTAKELLPVAGNGALMSVQGKVAGLSITNQAPADPNSGPSIQLRGASSRQAGLGPLFVINGVPGGNIDNLNQNDIESIDVLKGGAASAIYGTRGSNGVVIITTKKGTAQSQAFYDGYTSFDLPTNQLKLLPAEDFRKHTSEGPAQLRRSGDYGGNTDWLKAITRDVAISHKQTLQFSGGTTRSNYILSLDYRDAEGLDLRSKKEEYGARLNLNHTAANNLYTVSATLAPRYIKSNNSSWEAFSQALNLNPTLPVMDTLDPTRYLWTSGVSGSYNPVEELKTVLNGTEGKYLDWNASFRLNLSKDLYTQVTLGNQTQDFFDFGFTASTNSNVVNGNKRNSAYRNYKKSDQKSFEWIGNYSVNIKQHSFKLLGGYSYYYFNNSGLSGSNSNFPSDVLTYNNLGTGLYNVPIPGNASGDFTFRGVGTYKNDSKLIGFFSRLNYDLANKYYFSASLRREGSSKFGFNNKWGYFPAASFGWRITNEEFFPSLDWLNELKFRADYGVTGNQDFNSYGSLDLYGGFGYYTFNGVSYQVWGPTQNTNYDLRWEKSENINIGLDFELLKNKLSGSLNYYTRTNKDLLGSYNVSIPPNIREQTTVNVGTMKNTGLEVQLNGDIYKSKNFNYSLNFAGATNQNKFVSFSNQTYSGQSFQEVGSLNGPGIGGVNIQRLEEGERIGNFYMLRSAGIDATGRILVYNKEGKIVPANRASNNDRQIVGNGLPKFTASLGNSFAYKNVDLNIYLRGAFGYQIFNTTAFFIGTPTARSNANVLASAYGKGKYAVLTNSETASTITDYFLEKGDFLKLDNVTIGYNFKAPVNFLTSGRLYVTGRNLYTFTKYTTGDPEAVQVNGLAPGLNGNLNYYPSSLQLLVGLQFKF